MLVKPFAHGKGSGDAAVYYLLRMDYHGRQEHPPNILRGDPEMTKELINSIDREWKFTAGVCSWSGEDTITPEQEVEIMERFEELAFAGLEHNQYNILWVRHSHANHHELHFVIPRMELSTGNAFNAFPPGWEKDFSHFKDYMNVKHSWSRPDDPDRKRMFTPSNADIIEARLTRWGQNTTKLEKDNVRKDINNFIKGRIENGLIHDRADIISTLQEVGLQINREGKNYISVKDPDSDIKIRLKGKVYEHQWRAANGTGEATRENKAGTESKAGTGSNPDDVRGELAKIEQGLTTVIRKRAIYNENRYPSTNQENIEEACKGSSLDEQNIPKVMGEESIHRSSSINRDVHSSVFHSRLDYNSNKRGDSRIPLLEQNPPNNMGQLGASLEENKRSICCREREREIHGISERYRFQTMGNKRSTSNQDRLNHNSEDISSTLNLTDNQGNNYEQKIRARNYCTRDDRIYQGRDAEELRGMEKRATKGVELYTSQVGMLRRIIQSIELLTQRLREVAKSKQRDKQRSIKQDHDFER